jgi:hypothetical protein
MVLPKNSKMATKKIIPTSMKEKFDGDFSWMIFPIIIPIVSQKRYGPFK